MMKIAFNSEERQLHIVAGGASHFSEYVDGFRFELRSKNTDLRLVESSLRDAVCAIRAIVEHIAVMDPEEESAPGIDPEAAEGLNKKFGY